MSRPSAIEIEILRNAFISAAREMSVTLFRGAHTPIIYESKDCSVGLYDADARLLGQAPGLPIFLGGLEACITVVLERFGAEALCDGDVFVMNDSYLQGSHLTDITVLAPIFHDSKLIGFAATRADGGHLGGKDLGVSNDTTHIYQEGMRITPVRLVKAGKLDQDLLELIAINSYFHAARRGDLAAQIAACFKGRERLRALFEQYGTEKIEFAKQDIFRQSQELDAAVVAEMPDGVYRAAGTIDNDGISDVPVPIKVEVTIAGEQMSVDVAGSSPPTRGAINSGSVQVASACRLAFKQIVNSDLPVTGGSFRNLAVRVPEHSIFNAREPSPCQWYYTPLGLLIDLVQCALAPVLPEIVTAAHFGDSMIVSFTGAATDGDPGFAYIAAELGGWGAHNSDDGQDCMINVINGDFKTLPVEFVESCFPISIHAWALRQDSGGAGRFRGGLGERKVFRVERDGTLFSCWLDRTRTPAWGLFGGTSAASAYAVVNEGREDQRRYNKVTDLPLAMGDTVTLYTGGGGGYGEPRERPRESVAADLRAGYISTEQAWELYGYRA